MNWLRQEFERAKRRNALIPPHARPTICGPAMTTRKRPADPTRGYVMPLDLDFLRRGVALCDHKVDSMGSE